MSKIFQDQERIREVLQFLVDVYVDFVKNVLPGRTFDASGSPKQPDTEWTLQFRPLKGGHNHSAMVAGAYVYVCGTASTLLLNAKSTPPSKEAERTCCGLNPALHDWTIAWTKGKVGLRDVVDSETGLVRTEMEYPDIDWDAVMRHFENTQSAETETDGEER